MTRPAGIAMVNIDRFRKLNDRHSKSITQLGARWPQNTDLSNADT
jgi:hypothetical protein